MFADPNTRWWSIMALRMSTALLAGVAFIAVANTIADARADAPPADVQAPAAP